MEDEWDHVFDQHGDFADQEEYEEYVEFALPAWARAGEEPNEDEVPDQEYDPSEDDTDVVVQDDPETQEPVGPSILSGIPWWGESAAESDFMTSIVGTQSQLRLTADRAFLFGLTTPSPDLGSTNSAPLWTVPLSRIAGARPSYAGTALRLVIYTPLMNELYVDRVPDDQCQMAIELLGHVSELRDAKLGTRDQSIVHLIPSETGPLAVTPEGLLFGLWARIGRKSVARVKTYKSDLAEARTQLWNVTIEGRDEARLHLPAISTDGVRSIVQSVFRKPRFVPRPQRSFGAIERGRAGSSTGIPYETKESIQRAIRRLQGQLREALRAKDASAVARAKEQLIARQIAFCRQLRGRPLDQRELEQLGQYYTRVAERESQEGPWRRSICWVCLAGVTADDNPKCDSCRWLVCVCGACQCPDFWDGRRRTDPECQEQPIRLGRESYLELVKARRRRFGEVM